MSGQTTTKYETAKSYSEPLYEAYERGGKYYLSAFADRKTAEDPVNPVRHLTVIIVPFAADGKDKGKWIVHDRTEKQWAKGKVSCKSPSYNFFGGHVKADITKEELLGCEIPQYIFDNAARDELSEELLVGSDNNEKLLEIWEDKTPTGKSVGAKPYPANKLIPVGMTEFDGGGNQEFSYFYALPISGGDIHKLIAADDYGMNKNVRLTIAVKSEMELLKAPYRTDTPYVRQNGEICDAITRLWENENDNTYNKLIEIINGYIQ